jgi:UDP-N-acetylglucosamine 1-carboxyvinyltransferase
VFTILINKPGHSPQNAETANSDVNVLRDQRLYITGGKALEGEILVQGAKNSVLPILAAAALVHGEVLLHNCPDLSDAYAACRILTHLGCKCIRNGSDIIVNAKDVTESAVPDELMRKMRSSIVFMGAIIGRNKTCRLSMPGGCELGARPIDLHVRALEAMGANIHNIGGVLNCDAPNGLKGADITLTFASVGATENIILAAVLADGVTTINNAAREPEIVDLAEFLNASGAKITGAGNSEIVITGVERLHSAEFTIMADRIAAATYLCAAASTRGTVVLKGAKPKDLGVILDVLTQMNCKVYAFDGGVGLSAANRKLVGVTGDIRTGPFPAFPTDAQPMFLALATTVEGTTIFYETVFENRYQHVPQLRRLGANVRVFDRTAIIEGVPMLTGADLSAADLRGGAALVTAALAARGKSTLTNLCHLDRGYEHLAENLRAIGADIYRK